jgi:hypothetical protein
MNYPVKVNPVFMDYCVDGGDLESNNIRSSNDEVSKMITTRMRTLL